MLAKAISEAFHKISEISNCGGRDGSFWISAVGDLVSKRVYLLQFLRDLAR
jgi:hypothetical protein